MCWDFITCYLVILFRKIVSNKHNSVSFSLKIVKVHKLIHAIWMTGISEWYV